MPKLKGAVIGFGFISGKGHVPAFQKRADVEITAVADICPARLEAARAALPSAKLYSSWEELFQQETSLDFVDIATPPCDHARIAVAALAKGWHVLCEKPLATSTAEAREMLLAAAKHKRVLFPCHNYKHAPVVQVIRETIASGRLGKITGVTLQTFRNTHAKGVKEWKTDWRRERKFSGGGIAMDHGSHTFYLTFDWLQGLPTEVTAKALQVSPEFPTTEDNLTCVLSFPNGFAHAYLSWTAGVRKVIYTVQGTEGAIMVHDDDAEISVGFPNTGSHQGTQDYKVEKFQIESDWMDASHTKWFNSMFDKFKGCMDRGEWVNDEIKESYMCIEVIEKCYASSAAGSSAQRLDSSFQFLPGGSR